MKTAAAAVTSRQSRKHLEPESLHDIYFQQRRRTAESLIIQALVHVRVDMYYRRQSNVERAGKVSSFVAAKAANFLSTSLFF